MELLESDQLKCDLPRMRRSMTATEISEALKPFLVPDFQLSADQLSSVQTYLELLLKWNSKINLTAIREPKEIITRHFGESFFAARHLPIQFEQTAIDIGSGAGFPSLSRYYSFWSPMNAGTMCSPVSTGYRRRCPCSFRALRISSAPSGQSFVYVGQS